MLEDACQQADCVLLDGTFWDDEEPIRHGIGPRTAPLMGHWPIAGEAGSLCWLKDMPVPHKAYIHINNTNPILEPGSLEAQEVCSSGFRVAEDGDMFQI